MAIIRLQGDQERKQGIYYEFDTKSAPIGEGGMGKVYRGRRINMRTSETRDVAIKFMFSGLPATSITRARNEAGIRIQHENLVEMMGFLAVENIMPDGSKSVRYHVVSELLIGVSLSDLLQGVVTDQMGNVIPYAQTLYKMHNEDPCFFAVTIVKKILAGILSLHDAGYIHRDIDPSNIMITTDGKVKLIDFGIAKKISALKTLDRNLTTAGQFMGKPQYAAPELCIGDVKNHNKPTDIYSIGIMLFQLIVGHLPFEGSAMAIQSAHIHRKMPLFLIKDRALRKIIQKATEKDCMNRYQSAAEFRAALDSWNPIASHVSRLPLLVAGGIGVVGLIVAIVLLWPSSKPATEQQEPVANSVVVDNTQPDNINEVRKQLKNPASAKQAFQKLKEWVDAGDITAMYIMSRLYAESTSHYTLDNDIVTMQANLQGVVKPNQEEARRLLEEIINKDHEHYQALYDLAAFYFDLRDNELDTAKTLLNRAYEAATKAEDPVYVNKINALLRLYN
ncbi:MAG: protein kinase [Sodaliphilus sp.]